MNRNDSQGAEKRLLPRLTVTHEVFRDSITGKFFAVADLSQKGMALRVVDREDLYLFMVGAEVQGTLNIRREKFQISGRVRHLGRELVGIEFDQLPSSVEHALEGYLDPTTLGRALRPVPTGDASLLYASTSGTELLLNREADGRYTKITVMILGSLIQWDARTGLRTGLLRNSYEDSLVFGVTQLETMLFDEDSAIDPQKLNLAKQLISSSNLSEDLKKFCIRRLEGASA
jgi:hypothetical protein